MSRPLTTPGTEQDAWLALDRKHVAQSRYAPPLIFERGEGTRLWDVAGKCYLDFESGQFCMNCGHGHPRVTEALQRQATELMQIGNRFTNTQRALLGERLAEIAPDPLGVSFFCSTGSEANELAMRLAKMLTGRYEIVALARGYHGRTLGSFTVSSAHRLAHRNLGPQMSEI